METPTTIYTISQLNQAARNLLEGNFPLIWVEGEISNLARPASGHCYFSLKDTAAQIRCAFFQMHNRKLGFVPDNGMKVLARARVSLYEPRGDFQLIVDHLEELGDGALRRAFEILKQRLAAEGLFAATRKKPLPILPRCIGVVTSPTGAAIRDILSILKRRFPSIPVIIYPTVVQGNLAAKQIVEALQCANARQECDVIILARGGGSLEDLWPFNEEIVARAIVASEIPIVSGVGHEIDFTIADLAADSRAATPSAAAELVSPDSAEWKLNLHKIQQRFSRSLFQQMQQRKQQLEWLRKRLRHPRQLLQDKTQRLDDLEHRLRRAWLQQLKHWQGYLREISSRLQHHNPQQALQLLIAEQHNLQQRLIQAMQYYLQQRKQQLGHLSYTLDAVSPLATLQRGYAIVTRQDNHKIVRSVKQVALGDTLTARLNEGQLKCKVVEKIS